MARNKKLPILVILLLLAGFFVLGGVRETWAVTNKTFSIDLSQEALIKGYTVSSETGDFKVGITPAFLNEGINVVLKTLSDDECPGGQGKNLVSGCYTFDLNAPSGQTNFQKPLWLRIKINSDSLYAKKIYFFNETKSTWELLSSSNQDGNFVQAESHLAFAKVAVFSEPYFEGIASWFRNKKHEGGSAVNDLPIGTKLKVTNLDNGKAVNVEVTSHGLIKKNRLIDLEKLSFAKIARTGQGLARVRVEVVSDKPATEEEPAPGGGTPEVKALTPYAKDDLKPAVVSAKSAVVIDEKTGQVLFEKNSDLVLPIASLTKLMFASVFLDTNPDFNKVVSYAKEDSAIGGKLYIKAGEELTVKDLWYSALIGSANNAVKTLVRTSGLTHKEFVSRMNAKAKEWGLKNTHFTDPTGLEPTNVSTAAEVAKMASLIFKDFRMLTVTTTKAYGFRTLKNKEAHTIKNTDQLLTSSSFHITGAKTGYLDEAGYTFVFKARNKNGPEVIAVVLGAASSAKRFSEAENLVKWAFNNYDWR